MCGVAGFVTTTPDSGSVAHLGRMTEALRHRGPDDFGFYHDPWAHLGHRRLSIIDVAGGHQPLLSETGSLAIIYNGEVYNHADLRSALERAGHRYRTRSDTETILHAYRQHGAECLTLFRGMFAFAIWDQNARRLFCARDRLGVKPFYYYWDGRLFAFASEIKALFEHPAISPALDDEVLPEVLAFGYASGERTLFRGIRKLLPAHHLTFELGASRPELRIERYWDVQPSEAGADTDWAGETRRRLEESVRMRLMSEVPLGVFLSGGVDSSAISAIVKKSTEGPVKTFAVGYREAKFSELSQAAQVARAIGTEHHEATVGAEEFFGALPRLIWHEDEPIAWPSSVSLYFVSKLASEQVKVVLTGEGSDELFGGYERYRWHLWNERAAKKYNALPEGLRRWIRRQATGSRLLSPALRRKLGHTILGRENTIESLLLDNFYCAFSRRERGRLLLAPDAAYQHYMDCWARSPGGSTLQRMLYADRHTYLVELLMKQDQMSMACSIESRVPFLDHTLVEFAAAIPDRLKIHRGVQKHVLKQAVRGLVPRAAIHRRKMGFPTPLREWLRGPCAEPLYRALESRDGLVATHFDRKAVRSLVDRHLSGAEDATDQVWRLANLQLWGDLFLTGRRNEVLGRLAARETARSAV
jgi:asparagine synthase (glutamine-hydrolysing)